MDLKLVHNKDKVVILAVTREPHTVFKLKSQASIFLMAIRDDTLMINLDKLKIWPNYLIFPQVILHEFLHFMSRYSFFTTLIIHKIHNKTRGILL